MIRNSYAPASGRFEVGQPVEVITEPGTFLIVRIDRRRHCADLMRMGLHACIEFGVHLSCVRPIREHESQRREPILRPLETASADD